MNKNSKAILRDRVNQRNALLVPGAFNALSARMIADLGFEALYLSGAGLTNMYFGLPDLAFISLRDVVEHTAAIRDAVEIPLIVDIDTGFGGAFNIARTVKSMIKMEGFLFITQSLHYKRMKDLILSKYTVTMQ